MKYMLLIYDREEKVAKMSEQEGKEDMARWFAFDKAARAETKLLDGAPLQPTMTATTVRGNNGKTLTSDGPFAETKEQLGGFYMIDAKDLDEAISVASKMPNLSHGGSVEVRPVMEIPQQA